jgi:leader peptidase (prepilin peptidase)/N-methyltransferase
MADTSLHTTNEAGLGVVGAHDEFGPVSTLPEAWSRSGAAARAAAITVAVVLAVSVARHDDVTVVSGAAVMALVPAGLVDVIEQRLPNRMIVLAALVLTGGIAGAAVGMLPSLDDGWIGDLVAGAGFLAGPLLALHLLSPASMGFGDVKLAVVLGAGIGIVHPQLALVALFIASGGTALVGVAARRRQIAFGPGLILGAAITIAAAPVLLTSTTAPPTFTPSAPSEVEP